MKELRGIPAAKSVTAHCKAKIASLAEKGIVPTLAILRVGEREDDLAYERGAIKRFTGAGAQVRVEALPGDCTQDELEATIRRLNEDTGIHSVLMFNPLPRHLDNARAKALLDPAKDADCLTPTSAAGLFLGDKSVNPPCTPQAVIELCDFYGIQLEGARVALIGRSLVVGKPLAMLLISRNATVTVCHTRTRDLPAVCREADIVIAAAGKAKMVGPDYVRPGQTVIDVGINVVDGNLCGDVDYDAVAPIVDAITPVPGGVGSVTTSVLLENTVRAAEKTVG